MAEVKSLSIMGQKCERRAGYGKLTAHEVVGKKLPAVVLRAPGSQRHAFRKPFDERWLRLRKGNRHVLPGRLHKTSQSPAARANEWKDV